MCSATVMKPCTASGWWDVPRGFSAILFLLAFQAYTKGALGAHAAGRLGQRAAVAIASRQQQQQQRWPARALLQNYKKPLKTEDEPYGAVGAPDKWMYRMLSGTWLDFRKEAGDMDDSEELCAKATHAVACSNRYPNEGYLAAKPKGTAGREWPDDRRRLAH